MASVRLRGEDLEASVEQFLMDNNPDGDVRFIPTANEAHQAAFLASLGQPDAWIALQFIDSGTLQPSRTTEDRRLVEFRLLAWDRRAVNDRHGAVRICDMFLDLLKGAYIPIKDRTDTGTTTVGDMTIDEAITGPNQRDSRGISMCVGDVTGRAYSC